MSLKSTIKWLTRGDNRQTNLTLTELSRAVDEGYVKRNGDDRMEVPLTLAASEVAYIAKNITKEKLAFIKIFELLTRIAQKDDQKAAKTAKDALQHPKFRHLS